MPAPNPGHIPMRLLAPIRLSRLTDESTSPERQREQQELTAKLRGDRIIAHPTDLDISGAVSPFERPELGPWLTDPDKINQWDGLVVAKLDRLSRSILDFQVLLNWCQEHNKIIISVAEGFDLGTTWGRMVANMLMVFAQFERERISERRTEGAEKLRAIGRWNGGRPPYGYMTKEADGGTYLFQNPDTAPVVRWMVNAVLDGMNLQAICDKLNDDDVPTSRNGTRWLVSTVKRMLTSRYLRGELIYDGKTVQNPDGTPVCISDEPIISELEWGLLQDTLRSASRPRNGNHKRSHLLLRIAYCGECDAPMYHQSTSGDRNYYRCGAYYHGAALKLPRHETYAIRAETLEDHATAVLLKEYGKDRIQRRAGAGKDYQGDLKRTRAALDELEDQYLGGGLRAERFASMTAKFEARIDELEVLAANAEDARWEDTGETVRQRWDRSDPQQRQAMLRRLGIQWTLRRVYRISDRAWRWQIDTNWLPVEESHERLQRQAA